MVDIYWKQRLDEINRPDTPNSNVKVFCTETQEFLREEPQTIWATCPKLKKAIGRNTDDDTFVRILNKEFY